LEKSPAPYDGVPQDIARKSTMNICRNRNFFILYLPEKGLQTNKNSNLPNK